MNKKDFRVVFMGTPEFAAETLKVLIENEYEVVGVVTAPDKPAGRGRKLTESAVKKLAANYNIPVLQPLNLKSEDFIKDLSALAPDVQVVVAFRMLPKMVWSLPTKGTFNLHASLLPQYRGAAPINWAIINGETKTGATTFFIDEKIDTGEIIDQTEVDITPDMNAGELHDLLMAKGAELVLKTLKAISENRVKTMHQRDIISDDQVLKPAPKIFKEDCLIDWSQNGSSINNKISGLSPYPTAWTHLNFDDGRKDSSLKLFKAVFLPGTEKEPGSIDTDGKSYLKIACQDGWLDIKCLQLAGKKQMPVDDLLRGFNMNGVKAY